MLTKPTTTTTKPSFEDAEEIAVVEMEVATVKEVEAQEATAAALPSAADKAKVSSTVAVAKVQGGMLSKVGGKYKPAFQDAQNQFDPTTLDYDTFPRVVVGLDGFTTDGIDFGKEIDLQVLSWNYHFMATPGGPVNPETTKLVKYSLDGITLDDNGESALEYVKYLRESEGYATAELKKYLSIYGMVISEDAELNRMISIQIPPRSLAKFTGFQIEQGVKIASGQQPESDIIHLTQIKVDGKNAKYAAVTFSSYVPPVAE